jgi:hypothetical protein
MNPPHYGFAKGLAFPRGRGMRRRACSVAAIIMPCLMAFLSSCDVQGPERFVRPPIIRSYSPTTSTLTAAIGDTLDFSIAAFDPDRLELEYFYVLGDSVVWSGADWTYVVEDTGDVDVGGLVSNGASESEILWHVRRVRPENLPPVITGGNPPEPYVTVIIGGVIDFSITAIDPEGESLSYVFTLNGNIVSVERRYMYQAVSVGMDTVRAVVTDGESFVSRSWSVRVAAEPDDTPPAKVAILSIGPGALSGEVEIEWSAVGDDDMTGLPSYYVARTSPVPILDEYGWNSASERSGEPAPVAPGETMRMTVKELPPARTVYIAVRAVDDFGNLSPLSDLAGTVARGMKIQGTVRDALTGLPIDGIQVILLSVADTTGTDGSFVLRELPAGTAFIKVQDEDFVTVLGYYFDLVVSPYTVIDGDALNFYVIPNAPLVTTQYSNFRDWYLPMTELQGTTVDLLNRWDIPCRVYVPPLVKDGLDYELTVKDAFGEWEDAIGMNVFEFVDAEPDTGVYVSYSDNVNDRDLYTPVVQDSRRLTVRGMITLRTVFSAAERDVFRVTVLHEVGHSLGLNHSDDSIHLMIGGRFPGVSHPTTDEIDLARVMYHLPRGFPAAWIQDN